MLENLFRTGARKALYAVAGSVLAAIQFGLVNFHPPTTNPIVLEGFKIAAVAINTGVVAALLRRLNWDPSKAS